MNTNCLSGLSCPECESLGPFQVSVHAVAVVHDDGIDDATDHTWDDDSFCACMESGCNFSGTVKDFESYEYPYSDVEERAQEARMMGIT